MRRAEIIIKVLPPGILAFLLMAVYLSTMATGLTWANSGTDGGDLIAAAATGGIAHPTGYPVYLLLAGLFQLLPVGSLAFRTNLMSAFVTASAAVLVYGLVIRSISPTKSHRYWLAGLASGFAFGLAPLIWSQAIITEVYALHSLFVALLLYLSMHPITARFTQRRQDCLVGLTFGLSMGNHVTTILLLPVLILAVIIRKPGPVQGKHWADSLQVDGHSLIRKLAWLAIGLLVYLTLPLRALSHPPVNWGNPVNFSGFLWLVSGSMYQRLLLGTTLLPIWERFRTIAALLLDQFGIIGLTAGLTGLIILFRPNRLYISMLWVMVVSLIFAIGYSTSDAYLYLIPAFLCFAVWIGMGVGGLVDKFPERFHGIGSIVALFLIMTLMSQAWNHRSQVDASHDQRAEYFGRDVLLLAPEKAIVFAKGDEAVFTLWYFQYALGNRSDLAIVATDLLQYKWYLETLHTTYPNLNLPDPFPFTTTVVVANPGRSICYVQYIQAEEINCLPATDSQSP
jgi:hypothetical protein